MFRIRLFIPWFRSWNVSEFSIKGTKFYAHQTWLQTYILYIWQSLSVEYKCVRFYLNWSCFTFVHLWHFYPFISLVLFLGVTGGIDHMYYFWRQTLVGVFQPMGFRNLNMASDHCGLQPEAGQLPSRSSGRSESKYGLTTQWPERLLGGVMMAKETFSPFYLSFVVFLGVTCWVDYIYEICSFIILLIYYFGGWHQSGSCNL